MSLPGLDFGKQCCCEHRGVGIGLTKEFIRKAQHLMENPNRHFGQPNIFLNDSFCLFLDICPEVGLLDHIVNSTTTL